MSEHHPHGATTIRASKGSGGAGKWLLGSLAAVVLAGGGYAAYKTFGPEQQNPRTAYEDTYSNTYSGDARRAAPLQPLDDTAQSASAPEEPAAPSATRRTTAPRQVARANTVPEATIGITPVNATTDDAVDSGEIIVNAPPRPVWSRTPSAQRLTAMYPERARMYGREGDARLACTVQADGKLDCARVEESSSTFGAAAMRVAGTLRHAPQRADGSNAAGTPVNLHVVFRLEDEQRNASR